MKKITGNFTFKQHDRIGDSSAEQDKAFLEDCFIDNGSLQILTNCSDSRAIIVGRTGAGKSALLRRLQQVHEHIIEIEPESLAIGYISNSTIITFFIEEIGVKMDLFYKLLWRHVFIVEILKHHYKLYTEAEKISWFDKLGGLLLHKRGKIEAFQYLNQWGTKFWTTTEERIKETTTVLEKELTANVGFSASQLVTVKAGGKLNLSEQETKEFKKRGEDIINNIQMSRLSTILESLDEDILTDPVRRYIITVDRLDEKWVDEQIRCKLIRGLIETIRDFNNRVKHAKIIIALRSDLIDRIYKVTSDSGFQQEKYSSLNLEIYWNREDLIRLLDERVQRLVRHRYTKQIVTLKDILPGSIGRLSSNQSLIDYLLDRTLMRPRDAIEYLNLCLTEAVNAEVITPQIIQSVEFKHSQQRIDALTYEWSFKIPNLIIMTRFLKGFPPHFKLDKLSQTFFDGMCLELMTNGKEGEDLEIFQKYFCEQISLIDLRRFYIESLYTIGIFGIKLETHMSTLWSQKGPITLSASTLNDDVALSIHKTFWRVLGVN